MINRTEIYIDGHWIRSAGQEALFVTNPVTEETIASVPRGSAADVDGAAEAAARAFPA
ncbi:MAG: aldehyde dehydrogenase family protein, partial [Rhodospirillales bacterium]|nr:aldehyde dehydrogenase family protein [Rhodospirillales bacterium]